MASVANATCVHEAYVEYAILLGEETQQYGRSRVQNAVFHGEAVNAGAHEGRINRADVLLWALQHSGAEEVASPYVAELGVDSATTAARMLELHPSLRWLGVDVYKDMLPESEGGYGLGSNGGDILQDAVTRLRPWLGSRAQLFIGPTSEAVALWAGATFDLVFVDADHHGWAVANDLASWGKNVRPGGVLAGHDYSRSFLEVVHAVNSMLPFGATLHLAPDMVYWWEVPFASVSS